MRLAYHNKDKEQERRDISKDSEVFWLHCKLCPLALSKYFWRKCGL